VLGHELKIVMPAGVTIFNSAHYFTFEGNLSVLTSKNGEGIV